MSSHSLRNKSSIAILYPTNKTKQTAELVDILLKICQVQNNIREFKSMGIMLQLELFE